MKIIEDGIFKKDSQEVQDMISQGYLNVSRHPEFPLLLWNYSKTAQIYHVWNEVTEVCRGLVTDLEGHIVSRPFRKFWNYEEIQDKSTIPGTQDVTEITEKLDGSLGIMYWWNSEPYITTRGNFESLQGAHATEILHERYNTKNLPKDLTFLFEIIWPQGDPHCIRYPGIDDIFLIGVIRNSDGLDYGSPLDWSSVFKTTKIYSGLTDYTKARDLVPGDNREGFVVRFKNSSRIKLKYPGYLKLHYLKSYLTPKVIFEYVSEGKESELMKDLESLDFEQLLVVHDIIGGYKKRYQEILQEASDTASYIKSLKLESQADIAKEVLKSPYSGLVFMILRDRDLGRSIWKYMKKEL